MSDVTRILNAIEHGDGQAAENLLPLVYDELRKLAAAKLANEKPGQTLQARWAIGRCHPRACSRSRRSRVATFRPCLGSVRLGGVLAQRRERVS